MTTSLEVMQQKAREAWKHAYAPYSGFLVGACISTPSGELFSCGNIENAAYPLSVCAETGAIIKMISSGIKEIADVVIMSKNDQLCPPCGACRQQIREFSTPNTRIHLCTSHGIEKTLTLSELLPYSFGPEYL